MPKKIPHSIDGIEEYDNPVPRWLMWLLYATIVIAAVYLVLYPGFWAGATGWNQHEMYKAEMAEAEARYASARPEKVDVAALAGDPAAIAEGKKIFSTNCAACHGPEAGGAIGPDLTDSEWLYGGAPAEIARTVSEGTAGGMPPWESQLGAEKIAKVAVFVHSLGGGE